MKVSVELKSKVCWLMIKVKKTNNAWYDEIIIKMLTALNEFTEIINEMYNSSEILEALSNSIFTVLPKKVQINIK